MEPHCKKRLAVFLFPAGMSLTFFYNAETSFKKQTKLSAAHILPYFERLKLVNYVFSWTTFAAGSGSRSGRYQGNRIRKDRKEELQNSVIPRNFSYLKRTSFFFLALPRFYNKNFCHLFACKTWTLCTGAIAWAKVKPRVYSTRTQGKKLFWFHASPSDTHSVRHGIRIRKTTTTLFCCRWDWLIPSLPHK